MSKVLTKFHKGQKGFTLIELLVVVAILGVIAAVAIPNILGFIGEGDVAAAQSEESTIWTAITAYMYENDGDVPQGDPATELYPEYLIREPQFSWDISVDNDVISVTPTGDNPLANGNNNS